MSTPLVVRGVHNVLIMKTMETMADKRVFSCWIVIEPAQDVKGLWVSHCLNFDVISQGEDPQSALEGLKEAIAMTVLDDLIAGLEPRERAAPLEDWQKLERVLTKGAPIALSQVKPEQKLILATNLTFTVEAIEDGDQVSARPNASELPAPLVPLIETPPVGYQAVAC